MGMWGGMIPKRVKPEFPARITSYVLEMLASEDNHALGLIPYPYADIDWRGCPKIFFTSYEPPDERGNINVMFKLLQLHFIVCVLMQLKYVINIKFFNELSNQYFVLYIFSDIDIFDVEVDLPPPSHDEEDMEEQYQAITHEIVGKHLGHNPHRSQDRYSQDVGDTLTNCWLMYVYILCGNMRFAMTLSLQYMEDYSSSYEVIVESCCRCMISIGFFLCTSSSPSTFEISSTSSTSTFDILATYSSTTFYISSTFSSSTFFIIQAYAST